MTDHYEIVHIDGHEVQVREYGTGTPEVYVTACCECGQGAVRKTLIEAENAVRELHGIIRRLNELEQKKTETLILLAYVDPETHKVEPALMATREKIADHLVLMEKVRLSNNFITYELTEVEL